MICFIGVNQNNFDLFLYKKIFFSFELSRIGFFLSFNRLLLIRNYYFLNPKRFCKKKA
jgi:hypothetical protein